MKPLQVRAARAILQIGVRELAAGAGVTPATITRFETEKGGLQMATLDKIQRYLEAAGVIFIAENGEGPGVRLKKRVRDLARDRSDPDGSSPEWDDEE